MVNCYRVVFNGPLESEHTVGGSPCSVEIVWWLSRVPQQLIGERITVYNREKECIQVGTIKNFDSIKVNRYQSRILTSSEYHC